MVSNVIGFLLRSADLVKTINLVVPGLQHSVESRMTSSEGTWERTVIHQAKSGHCIFPKPGRLIRSGPKVGYQIQKVHWCLCVELYYNHTTEVVLTLCACQSALFSSTVASFILVSYQKLQPNPSDLTNQLLTQISQQLSALSNGTSPSAPLTTAGQSAFQPTASAVRVNTLWFTSLILSLSYALWAMLLQQWTQGYAQAVNRPYGPSKQARIHAFFTDGVERFALSAAARWLPVLLHVSFFLFCAGLVDFLFDLNHTVAYFSFILIGLGVMIYCLLTMMPLRFHNSPYQTPLSGLVWFVMESAPLLILWLRRRSDAVKNTIQERKTKIGRGMRRALEETASKLTLRDEARAIHWTLRSLDEDQEVEDFLDGLPGLFHVSTRHHSVGLRKELEPFITTAADKLFATCAITGLLPEDSRRERLTTCLKAIWCFPSTANRHFRAIRDQWAKVTDDPWGSLSMDTWSIATSMTRDLDPLIALRAHCVQALIAVMWRNGRWQCPENEAFALLQRQLGVFPADVERWYSKGNHLQLAVAANLLSHALPLLRTLERLETGPEDTSLKTELKGVLDTICRELDTSGVPVDLQARFANGADVMNVFLGQDVSRGSRQRTSFDVSGPWTKVFTPVEVERAD